MSDGERHRQPRVLVDVAAAVRLTHPRQVGQTQSLTGLVHSSTNVFPGEGPQAQSGIRTVSRGSGTDAGRETRLVINTATS